MGKKLKLSQWHDGSVKPAHVGWYQCHGDFAQSFFREVGFVWRKWTKSGWKWMNPNGRLVPAAFHYMDKWRGIVKCDKHQAASLRKELEAAKQRIT